MDRLALPYEAVSPDIDETPRPDEAPAALAARLAEEKARALAPRFPDALIVGSDQVPELGGRVLTKPGTAEKAVGQLIAAVGQTARFHTGVCLLDAASGAATTVVEPFGVRFRSDLDRAALERYVAADQPLDCAGSFRVESLGITLFESLEGRDPTALIGLSLIALTELLREAGVALP